MRPRILVASLAGILLLGSPPPSSLARSPAPDGSWMGIAPSPSLSPSASPAPVLDPVEVARWLGDVDAAERQAADALRALDRSVGRRDWEEARELLDDWSDRLDALGREIDDTPAPLAVPPSRALDCARSYAASYRERAGSLTSLAEAIGDDLDRRLDPGPRVPTYAPPWGPRNLAERLRVADTLLGPDRAGRHDPGVFLAALCGPVTAGHALPLPDFPVASRSNGIAFGRPMSVGIATVVLARNETAGDRAYRWRVRGARGTTGGTGLHRAGETVLLWALGRPEGSTGPVRVLRDAAVSEVTREVVDGMTFGDVGVYRSSFGAVRVPWRYAGGPGVRRLVLSVTLTHDGIPVALARDGMWVEGPEDEGVLLLPLDELGDAASPFDGMAITVDQVLAP